MEWTEEDAKRAAAEGWEYRYGYVAPIRSAGKFFSIYGVMSHLRKKGITSEWHRGIYLSLPWSNIDELMTLGEGWRATFDTVIRTNTYTFASDEEARAAVQARACADPPDPLCIKALTCIAKRRLLEGVEY